MLPKIPVTVNGVAADLCAKYPQTEGRIVKAVDLIIRGRIKWYAHDAQGEPIYECVSSDGSMTYTIHAGACTCPARKLCYHRIARGILVILASNKTEVAFGDALSLEDEQPPTATQGQTAPEPNLNHCAEHRVFVPTKRVQYAGKAGPLSKGLTISGSMAAMGAHLKSVLRVVTAAPSPH